MDICKILNDVYKIDDAIKNDGKITALELLHGLTETLQAEIRKTANAKTGKGQAEKIALKILKYRQKDDDYPALAKAKKTDTFTYVTDGYRLIRFKNDYAPDLPLTEEKSYPVDGLRKICENASTNANTAVLPTLNELQTFIKLEKSKRITPADKKEIIIYNLTDSIAVNAEYLLDILTVLPDATCKTPKYAYHTIYFTGKIGDACLCPLRINKG